MPRPSPSPNLPQRLFPLWEGRLVLASTGLILTLCAGLLLVFPPLPLRHVELRLYDLMLTGRGKPPASSTPVIVGIDEESLRVYGQWPWPRYRLASLVERLHELGAAVVALDFLMVEPDRTSPDVIMAERERDRSPARSDTGHRPLVDSNSRRLAKVLAERKTILGSYFDYSGEARGLSKEPPFPPPGMVLVRGSGTGAGWPEPTGTIRSLDVLTGAARSEGFTNAQHDMDGILRRVPLLVRHDTSYYPSLALGALLMTSPDRRLQLLEEGGETVLLWKNRRIPLDGRGNLLIDFRDGTVPFPFYSAKTILAADRNRIDLSGKIAVVGAWAKGLGDFHVVPSGQALSGLVVHATIIDNVLSGTFISRPAWARGAELALVIFMGILSTWLLCRPGFVLPLATIAAGACGCYWGGRELLLSGGMFLSPLLPMATPILVMTPLSLIKYRIEAHKVRQRNRDLIDAQDRIIVSLSALAEERDEETGAHILRTQHYVAILARHLATLPRYAYLDETAIDLITRSAALHDIGKVGIPDHILHKQGPLSDDEFAIMKTHPLIGAHALSKTIGQGSQAEHFAFLEYARQMVEFHHEKWDGTGYPHGLKGTDIPLAGRLMALADVYDALLSRRVYRQALSPGQAEEYILAETGICFDPEVVAAFMAKKEDFVRIARKLADEGDIPAH